MTFEALYVLLGIIAGVYLNQLDQSHSERMVFPFMKFCGAVLAILIIAGIKWRFLVARVIPPLKWGVDSLVAS